MRNSMLVVTVDIEGSPDPRTGMAWPDEEAAAAQRDKISQLRNSIWQLDSKNELRWLFVTNNDMNLHGEGAMRRLLWQLTSSSLWREISSLKTAEYSGMQQLRFHLKKGQLP